MIIVVGDSDESMCNDRERVASVDDVKVTTLKANKNKIK